MTLSRPKLASLVQKPDTLCIFIFVSMFFSLRGPSMQPVYIFLSSEILEPIPGILKII